MVKRSFVKIKSHQVPPAARLEGQESRRTERGKWDSRNRRYTISPRRMEEEEDVLEVVQIAASTFHLLPCLLCKGNKHRFCTATQHEAYCNQFHTWTSSESNRSLSGRRRTRTTGWGGTIKFFRKLSTNGRMICAKYFTLLHSRISNSILSFNAIDFSSTESSSPPCYSSSAGG